MASRPARTRARLSQNLLADRAAIARIVRAARIGPGDLVVEPGAGDGRLTAALAAAGAEVIAYEIDPVLAGRLRARRLPGVRCRTADFLRADPPSGPFTVVGNIPYAATSAIVRWCLRPPGPASATLVTQREYARKRTGDYGRWSKVAVESWPRYRWTLGARIDRTAFRPVPRVDSALLRLDRRDLLPAADLPAYRDLVALGFQGTGGSLHASLRRAHPRRRVDAAFRAAGLDPRTVVAHVHPDRWITLFRTLRSRPREPRPGACRRP